MWLLFHNAQIATVYDYISLAKPPIKADFTIIHTPNLREQTTTKNIRYSGPTVNFQKSQDPVIKNTKTARKFPSTVKIQENDENETLK